METVGLQVAPVKPTVRRTGRVATVAQCLRKNVNVDLTRGAYYRVLPDDKAAINGQVRVVDESGEDYLYPKEYFRVGRVSVSRARRLTASSYD